MRRSRAPALGLIALPVLVGACATPVYEQAWTLVRTQNLEIASALPEKETLELAREIESFRALAQTLTRGARFEASIPTRIYAFADRASFGYFAPPSRAVGFFMPTPRENLVALYPSRTDATDVIQHEYVHFLLRNRAALPYPRWYDEGFAQLLETVRVRDDGVELGRPPSNALRFMNHSRLEWVPLYRVLQARSLEDWSDQDVASFYFESWALVYYLHFGRDAARGGEEKLAVQLTRYLRTLAKGADAEQALEQGFGVGSDALRLELRKFLARGRVSVFSIPMDHFELAETSLSLQPLSPAEIATRLGWFSLVVRKPAQAQRYFEAALAADPNRARALAGLGDAYKFREREPQAQAFYEQALALDAEDALNHLDYAEYLHGRAETATAAEERAQWLSQARRHYVKSQQLDPSLPETYASYAATFLIEGEDAARGLDTALHAQRLLPSDLEIKLLLGKLYLKLGRYEDADSQARTVEGMAHDPELAKLARELREQIETQAGAAGG